MKNLITTLIFTLSFNYSFAQTPLGTEFTYQGELNDSSGNPHDGVFDFKFIAFDAQVDGTGNNLGQFVAEDIQVSNGIFTTLVDYSILGDEPFMGDKVWLEISVRIGTTTGGYQQLLPRQQVTATPYATHAQFVGSDAISDTEIQDGTIINADLATGSVTSDTILDNTIGTSDINSAQVQRRVNGTCGVGEFITTVNQDGSFICAADTSGLTSVTSSDIVDASIQAADIDTGSVTNDQILDGTIINADLSNNSITTAKLTNTAVTSAKLAADAVDSSKIIDDSITENDIGSDAVGEDEIITSEVQTRIGGTCSAGQYVQSVNEDGTLNCAASIAAGQTCPLGLTVLGFDSTGNIICDLCDSVIASANILDQSDRNVANAIGDNNCDDGSSPSFGYNGPAWYKFEGAAGIQMPETVPPINSCGAHAPGWLNDSHPVANGILQTSQVCFNWAGGTCYWSTNIQVTQCDGEYYYHLEDTPFCSLAYCGTN